MSHCRSPLTPLGVLTVVTVLLFAGAIGSAQIFGIRESARRATCTNNLRQLGIATHLYHDTYAQLPSLATDEGHWSWVALMLPFVEQEETFKKIDFASPAQSEKNKGVVTTFRMGQLMCPSRRGGRQPIARAGGDLKGGQPTDYVAVSTTDLKKFGRTSGTIIFRAEPPTKERGLRALKSHTTFGSITDGLGNTAMIGEKHMLEDWLGGKYDEPALVALNDQNTIRIASTVEKEKEDDKPVEKLRGLAADAKDKDDWKFGSAHPDICLFVFADSSVHPIKNKTDAKILRLLCDRADGERFKLPE